MNIASVLKADADHPSTRIKQLRGTTAAQPPELSPPTEAELEVVQLRGQVAQLQAALHDLEQQWQGTLDARVAEAARQIAADHRDDDQRRIKLLAEAADAAVASFRDHLRGALQNNAVAIATHALRRFCDLKSNDAQWLADIVREQIDQVGAAMVVAIALHPADHTNTKLCDELQRRLPAGCSLNSEPQVPQGSVRLDLRLGHVAIDPRAGLGAIVEALAGAGGDSHA